MFHYSAPYKTTTDINMKLWSCTTIRGCRVFVYNISPGQGICRRTRRAATQRPHHCVGADDSGANHMELHSNSKAVRRQNTARVRSPANLHGTGHDCLTSVLHQHTASTFHSRIWIHVVYLFDNKSRIICAQLFCWKYAHISATRTVTLHYRASPSVPKKNLFWAD